MKIIFATANKGKLSEAREILGPRFELVTPAELGITEDIPETGDTLQENSIQKARYLFDRTGLDCFADDTGLEVEALGGKPGVRTARFASDALAQGSKWPGAAAVKGDHDFDANIDRLLFELSQIPGASRRARFRTSVTLILNGEIHNFEGCMDGCIAEKKSGCKGFGYDPVFIADDCPEGVTLAEAGEEVKNRVSHRSKALKAMAAYLKTVNYE